MAKLKCRACGRFSGMFHRCPARHNGRAVPSAAPVTKSRVVVRMEEQARLRDAVYERFLATREGLLPAGPSVVTWDKRAGHRREMITVSLGEELDEVARSVFTEGHCHSLALALSEQGHDVAAIISIHALPGHEFDSVRHFYVVDKDDSRFGIDVNGRRTVEEIVSTYTDARAIPVMDAREVVASLVASNSYVVPDMEAGRWAAARLTW
jgi:hypothetical protein